MNPFKLSKQQDNNRSKSPAPSSSRTISADSKKSQKHSSSQSKPNTKVDPIALMKKAEKKKAQLQKKLKKDDSKNKHSKSIDPKISKHIALNKDQKHTKPKEQQYKKDKQISYSEEQLKQIDIKISKITEDSTEGATQIALTLMSWIWEANIPFSRNPSKIEPSKCFRKLLKLADLAHKEFYEPVCIKNIKFSPSFLKQLDNQIQDVQRSNFDQSNSISIPVVQKKYIIFSILKNMKTDSREVSVTLIFLLFEIIIFNYDDITNLEESIPSNLFGSFRYFHVKSKKYQLFSPIDQKILKELIVFTFSELIFLKTNVGRSSQFMKKKKLEEILWKFFMDFIKILNHQIKAKEFTNFRPIEAMTLETTFYLVTQFTNYARLFPIKNLERCVNIIQFENLALSFIDKMIDFNVKVLQMKDQQMKDSEIEIDGPNPIFKLNLNIPIYDWAILAIKSDERKTFDNLIKHCKKMFFKSLEKKSTSKYETFMNNVNSNENYARFTIQELPDEDKSFYDNSCNIQMRRETDEENSEQKLSDEKLKGFLSIPHMNFLVFKEYVPLSVQRLLNEAKVNCPVEKLEPHLQYLLILSNSQYLLALIKEVELSHTEMLNPEIGKGLIRLCVYCDEFKSIIIGQRFMKMLRMNALHKELTQKIFEKDNDYQRRLSTTLNGRNSMTRQQNPGGQDKPIPQIIEAQEIIEIRVKSCETMYFELIMEIQNTMPYIKIDHYVKQLLKNPKILRPEKFFVKLLKTQHVSFARTYFQELIDHYVQDELRTVDLMIYFELFSRYCLQKDSFNEVIALVQNVPLRKLLKFHCLLFSETFSDQSTYRIMVPEGISRQQKFNILTSAGYEDKTKFIDQFCPQTNQLILWRHYIKPLLLFDNIDKYVCIKCFFIAIHQVFSDPKSSKSQGHLNLVIGKLKQMIQSEKIDGLAAMLHFLSLALFPHQSSKINSFSSKNNHHSRQSAFISKNVDNTSGVEQKASIQILQILRQYFKQISDLFRTKQATTLRCLGDEFKKKTNGQNDIDEKIEDMKRREVAKMLNKMKNIHDYLIRSIIRFAENINFNSEMLKNFNAPQDFLEKIAKLCKLEHLEKQHKRSLGLEELFTPKLSFKLSIVSSENLFQKSLQKSLKRYNQNRNSYHDRLNFLSLLRCGAEMWVQKKLPTSKSNTQNEKETKNKTQFFVDKRQSKTKEKNLSLSIQSMISIEKIFEICIQSLKVRINNEIGVRESEILKQKIVAFDTLSLLFTVFTNKFDVFSFMAPLTAKTFKAKYFQEISCIIIEFLMKNVEFLGKQERQKQLVITLRLKALNLLLLNYKNHETYGKEEGSILPSNQVFWFVINTLILDKCPEIRFFIIKSVHSRDPNFSGFRKSVFEILVLSMLIASQECIKSYVKIAKMTLVSSFKKYFSMSQPDAINTCNSIVLKYLSYLVNLNTEYYLQKLETKLDYKEFFMILIDFVFEKKEAQNYLFAILQYLEQLANGKSQSLDISDIFLPVKWHFEIQIDFYLITRFAKKSLPLQRQSDKLEFTSLLKELEGQKTKEGSKKVSKEGKKQDPYEKKYPKSKQVYRENLLEALNVLNEVFSERAAKDGKKVFKTKKPISFMRNSGDVFDPKIKNKKEQLKKLKTKKEEKKFNTQSDIEI